MRIPVEVLGPGMGPNELIVSVPDAEHPEAEAFAHASQVVDGFLEVGQPVGMADKFAIVELPFETQRGRRRIRILRTLLRPSTATKAA